MKRRQCLVAGLALAAAALASPSLAQPAFPSKPLQLVVPFPPGGAVDSLGRKMSETFRETLGQPVVIVNRPGANGVIAWQSLVNSPADGYSVFAPAGQGLGFIELMNSSVKTRFVDDFIPIGSYANYPVVVVVSQRLPVRSLSELAEYARQNPSRLSYGTTGVGSGGHLLFELFKSSAGVPDDALPAAHFAGIAPELTALAGGHLDVAIMPLTSLAAQQIDAGTIRALAVSSDTRSPFRPEIPTVVEQGFPQLVAKDYLTYWVRRGTPDEAVARLTEALRTAVQNAEVQKLMQDMYFEVEFLEGAKAREPFEARAAQFGPIIKQLGIQLQ